MSPTRRYSVRRGSPDRLKKRLASRSASSNGVVAHSSGSNGDGGSIAVAARADSGDGSGLPLFSKSAAARLAPAELPNPKCGTAIF